jgi:hypothetical protein
MKALHNLDLRFCFTAWLAAADVAGCVPVPVVWFIFISCVR